jgi:hypothetical protein
MAHPYSAASAPYLEILVYIIREKGIFLCDLGMNFSPANGTSGPAGCRKSKITHEKASQNKLKMRPVHVNLIAI